jgi:hypothetical protein
MSNTCYSEINLHIIWHTKNSSPLLTPEIEKLAHEAIRQRVFDTPKVFFHEIGGNGESRSSRRQHPAHVVDQHVYR